MSRLGFAFTAKRFCRPLLFALLTVGLAAQAGGVAQPRQAPRQSTYRGTYIPKYAEPFTAVASLATESQPVKLDVDAGQVWRGIVGVTETIPVQPGAFTLVFPKWIPGEHGPTGPIDELAELRIDAAGKPIKWTRDLVDMYAFHITVPAGVSSITARFNLIMTDATGTMATHELAVINWNRVLLYQAGVDSHTCFFRPSITLPPDWHFGTALTEAGDPSNNHIQFRTLSLAMLVDSPLDMGRFSHDWTLSDQNGVDIQLDAFANSPRDLKIPSHLLLAYRRLPAEAFALYGSRHFANYHALLTLSNQVGFQGIEHHQSSDNRAPADFLINPEESLAEGDLIPHEMSHSWNGKYRRPADLATPNFQVPMRTDMLWVYEGMNQYLGDLLSFRTGIRAPKDYPEYVASLYAQLAYETGRSTTPIIALTTAAPYLYQATNSYSAMTRSVDDFYDEGELVWLDADTIIRTLSHGKKSLDTFLHLYTQPSVTEPITKTYTRAQIESLLNQVQPYDWHAFFQRHIYDIAPQPPMKALARAGWKLVYTSKPNLFMTADADLAQGETNRWYDLGLIVNGSGVVRGVRQDSPAWKAGLTDSDRVVSVDGHTFSGAQLNDAVERAQHSKQPISMQVEGSGWIVTLSIDYHGPIRYPHLERLPGTTDMLAQIMAPHATR